MMFLHLSLKAVNIPTVLHSLGAEDDGTIPGLPLATGCDGDWDGHVVGNPDAAIRPKLIFAWPSDLQQVVILLFFKKKQCTDNKNSKLCGLEPH